MKSRRARGMLSGVSDSRKRLEASDESIGLGRYPSARAVSFTFSESSLEMVPVSRNARETAAVEMPSVLAISFWEGLSIDIFFGVRTPLNRAFGLKNRMS